MWRCTETGHVVTQRNDPGYPGPIFHRSEPNGDRTENCALIAKGHGYLMADGPCSYTFAYMCKKD